MLFVVTNQTLEVKVPLRVATHVPVEEEVITQFYSGGVGGRSMMMLPIVPTVGEKKKLRISRNRKVKSRNLKCDVVINIYSLTLSQCMPKPNTEQRDLIITAERPNILSTPSRTGTIYSTAQVSIQYHDVAKAKV
jgi:hypothetical protein